MLRMPTENFGDNIFTKYEEQILLYLMDRNTPYNSKIPASRVSVLR